MMGKFTMSTEELKKMKNSFLKNGFLIKDDFIEIDDCHRILKLVDDFSKNYPLERIFRKNKGISLDYHVIDGEKIEKHLPDIFDLYNEIGQFASEIYTEELVPLNNKKANVNINITGKGGEYRWHYDRNAVTVLLYLNEVSGGEIHFYPKYRLYSGTKVPAFVQRWLDKVLLMKTVRKIFGKEMLVSPRPGRVVVIQGHTCLHSVRPVLSDQHRVNIVASYDKPNVQFPSDKELDTYLYTNTETSSDPNYTYKKSVSKE